MRRHPRRLAPALALACLLSTSAAARAGGQSGGLDGVIDLLARPERWQGDTTFFRFEDGVLVGESTPERPCTRTTYFARPDVDVADFELTARVRLRGGNSGLQFRSRVSEPAAPGGHVAVQGYQGDLEDGPNWSGCLYEQDGRGVMARRGERVLYGTDGARRVEAVADGAALLDDVRAGADADGWSTYRITAAGPALRLELNGVVTTEVFDLAPGGARSGAVAVQLHQGPPMRIEVAELRLRPLSPDEVADVVTEVEEHAPAVPATDGRPRWLWAAGEPGDGQVVQLERTFELDFRPIGGTLRAAADNVLEVLLDGQVVAVASDWARPVRRALEADDPLLRRLAPGRHVLRLRAENEGGPAGAWLDLELRGPAGERLRLVSDDTWRVRSETGEADAPARDLGPLGVAPWGEPAEWSDGSVPEALDPAEIEVAPGFRVERVYSVPRHRQGSWISLAFDPRGRLWASDQYGDLWRLTPGHAGAPPLVEAVDLPLGEAHGLAFVGDDLYAVVDAAGSYETGLYRASDVDGDGELDTVEQLRPLNGSGEHGPHAVVPTRDGTGLWILAGNHTDVPDYVDPARVPPHWAEDQLLPTIPDPNGHANGKRAPAGWLARCDLDGDDWRLWAIGMRNAYDVAETPSGELLTYDSDMEWDVGLPWYRPTRILHLVPGADFGWRTGSGKFPAWVPDSLPPVVDLGKASPTGVVLGEGSAFPGRWQQALFAADWAYGTIHAVHLSPRGASFGGEPQVFVRGAPLPVTDLAIGPDGALWFAVGGRRAQSGVYRVLLEDADAALAALPPEPKPSDAGAVALRRRLEGAGGGPATVGDRLAALVSEDPFLRHAARTLEDVGGAPWGAAEPDAEREATMRAWLAQAREEAGVGLDPWLSLERLLSIVRTGPAALAPDVHRALDALEAVQVSRAQRLATLRVRELALARMFAADAPPPDARELGARLRPHQQRLAAELPTGDAELDRQLGRLLAWYASVDAAPLGLPDGAGAASELVAALEAAESQEEAILWLYLLRNVAVGWSPELRARAWEQFEARQGEWRGGHSVRKYVDRIVLDLEAVAPRPGGPWAERRPDAVEVEASAPAPAFVRTWSLEELTERLAALDDEAWDTRDLERGAAAFQRASCHTCHRFGDVDMATGGGGIGPDLTGVARRFGLSDLARTIVLPSETIADQYQDQELWTIDDELFVGRVAERTATEVVLELAPPEEGQVVVPLGEVDEIRPHPLSRMPAGLLDVLGEDEVLDLFAYLRSGLALLEDEDAGQDAAARPGGR